MKTDAKARCTGCAGRRSILKLGLAGAGVLAMPAACMPVAGGATDGQGGEGFSPGSGSGGQTQGPPKTEAGGAGGSFERDAGDASVCATVSAADTAATRMGGLQFVTSTVGTFVLGRDAGGLYAISATCTHAGSPLSPVSGAGGSVSLICFKHGSAFDSNGQVTQGPASTALPHFAVEAEPDGGVKVCIDRLVDPTTRTTVP